MAKSEIEQDLLRLEAELKRLEAEYNMFFAGTLPKPPRETRSRVEALVRQYDRANIRNSGDRFRFSSLQARFSTFVDLWDRGLRAREEGRPGPFSRQPMVRTPPRPVEERTLGVASFRDPTREIDKLTELYESVSLARREVGADPVPFHKFAHLVKGQVDKLGQGGRREIAFRVAVKNGKVSFTARALKNAPE